jgi:hypothetical protein
MLILVYSCGLGIKIYKNPLIKNYKNQLSQLFLAKIPLI